MAWLGTWLQSLVIAVLLAICLDFILPTQHLGRYVKTVMGLFILFIFMSPILSLSKSEFRLDALMEQIYQAIHGEAYRQSMTKQQVPTTPLSSILQHSEQLQSANREQALAQTEQAIAAEMHHRLKAELHDSLDEVKVELNHPPGEQIEVAHVVVSLRIPTQQAHVTLETTAVTGLATEGASASHLRVTPFQPVRPVAPVHIEQHASEAAIADAQSSLSREEQRWMNQKKETCIAVLTRYWPLDASQINVSGQQATHHVEVTHE